MLCAASKGEVGGGAPEVQHAPSRSLPRRPQLKPPALRKQSAMKFFFITAFCLKFFLFTLSYGTVPLGTRESRDSLFLCALGRRGLPRAYP